MHLLEGGAKPVSKEGKENELCFPFADTPAVTVLGKNKLNLYYKDEIAKNCDELIVRTRDGSEGEKGGCIDIMRERGANADSIVAIGCVFMMKQCASEAPKDENKKLFCSLNPIMVDGTGMCGACRVSVGGETKFACVEGPFFDLAKVDFDELGKRRSAYRLLEIDAMPRHADSKCYS